MRLELRLAWRAVVRRPLLSGAMVLTIGLAMAAATTVFAVVHGVLLTPLPYAEPDRLVAVWETNTIRGVESNVVSPANYLAWRDRLSALDGVAAVVEAGTVLSGDGDPEQVGMMIASAEYFRITGARPLLGRLYDGTDDVDGAENVAVLSEEFWRRRFGADSGIVGRTLSLRGDPYTVVGVMRDRDDFAPRQSFFSIGSRDVWVPQRFGPDGREATGRYLVVVGRIAAGRTVPEVQREADALAATLRVEHPERQAGWGIRVVGLIDDVVGDARPTLLVVLAAVGLVLLIACANVADLQLARTLERQHEIAVRAALGAGRGNLVRQLLLEGAVIAGSGGVLGVFLAQWALGLLVAAAPEVPRLAEVGLSATVLGVSLLLVAGAAVAFGLVPAFSLRREALAGWLGHRQGTGRIHTARVRLALVGVQVAFSCALLIGASLLIRSLANRMGVDLGIEVQQVAVADISLSGSQFRESAPREDFADEVVARLAALPGVTAASVASIVPMSGTRQATSFRVLDRPEPARGEAPIADVRFVHHDYHRTLGIELVQGRLLTPRDRSDAPTVVVINETGARLLWPGESPLGKRIGMQWGRSLDAEIVGVVRDVRLQAPDLPVERATLYWSYRQIGAPNVMTFLVRGAGAPETLWPMMRTTVRELAPALPLYNLGSMEAHVARTIARSRFATVAFGLFAALALLLAMIGLYAVMASATQRRTREIGIRMALGATGESVRRMVLRQGIALAGPAILLGAVVSLGLTGWLRSMIFGVSPHDPLSFVVVIGVLSATALLACLIPAWRASAVNPIEAIRVE